MTLVHEYAVDPDVLTDWRSIRDLSDRVGVPKGRIIARFPKTWFRDVYDRLATNHVGDIKLEIALRRLERAVLPTGRPNKLQGKAWLDAALGEHQRKAFRAIITNDTATRHKDMVRLDDLSEDHPNWSAQRELPLRRSSEAWVGAIGVLLGTCSELIFIDPHFNPLASRFQKSLKSLCAAATKGNSRLTRIEYHVEKSDAWEASVFEGNCQAELPHLVPEGVSLEIFVWSCKIGGQDFHARYVLTNHGGIRFEQGLDENTRAQTTTDVSLLDEQLFQRRRTDFTFGHPECAFIKVHSFTLAGKRIRA